MNVKRYFFYKRVNRVMKKLVKECHIYKYSSKSIYSGFCKIVFKTNSKDVVIDIMNYDYNKFKSKLLYTLSKNNNEFKLEWLKIIQ